MSATEEEQVARLKKLWKDNASSVGIGIVLGLSALYGYKYWVGQQEAIAKQASNVYATALIALDTGNDSVLMSKTDQLIANYNETPYAVLAALMQARAKVEDSQLALAEEQLLWALNNSSAEIMQLVVRLRLAHVQMEQDKLDEAESTLSGAEPAGLFAALYDELRGDIHMARGDIQMALDMYRGSLDLTMSDAPGYRFLKLKHDNAAMQVDQGASQ